VALPHREVANDGTSCVVLTICGDHESLDLSKSLLLPGMDMCVSMVGILSGSTQSDATTLCST